MMKSRGKLISTSDPYTDYSSCDPIEKSLSRHEIKDPLNDMAAILSGRVLFNTPDSRRPEG
jgi:hypothetical protein